MDVRYWKHWFLSFDEQNKMATYIDKEGDEIEIECAYVVCPLCLGEGKHVNPNIDSHGISAMDMRDDPEFEECYFSGAYDIPCNACKGKRVYPQTSDKDVLELLKQRAIDDYNDQQTFQREMGWR